MLEEDIITILDHRVGPIFPGSLWRVLDAHTRTIPDKVCKFIEAVVPAAENVGITLSSLSAEVSVKCQRQ